MSDEAFELIPHSVEKKQALLPVNGFPLVTGARRVGRKTTRGGKRNRRGGQRLPTLPPRLELVNTVDVIRRYNCSSTATSVAVTRASASSSLGGIVTVANTTVTSWVGTYRINRIVVWPAAGTTVLIDTQISGSAEQALVKDSIKDQTLPTGTTVDSPVVWKPQNGSYLGMWQSAATNGGDQLFTLTCATGSVFDIHYQFTLCGVVAPSGYTTTSTVSLGTAVYMPLDTSNKIPVTGLNGANH